MKNKLIVLMFLSTASIFAQVPSYVPSSGLVGWWPFNGNAQDESGNGNHGTVNGATLTSDRAGVPNTAYSFDGINDFISTSFTGILGNGLRSVSFWAKQSLTNTNTFSQIILGWGGNVCGPSGIATGFYCAFDVTNNGIAIDANESSVTYSTPSSIKDNSWHHYVYVIDQLSSTTAQVKIFQDAQLLYQVSSSYISNGTINTLNQSNLIFGKRSFSCVVDRFYNGSSDDIGIWNRALTQQEITALYEGCNLNAAISPASLQVATGASAQFSTPAAAGTSYQWQSNPAAYGWSNVPSNSTYAGGSNNTLTINNVQLANHLQPFRVIATKGNCVDTSSVAFIEVLDTCITQDTLLTTVTDTLIIHTTLGLAQNGTMNTIRIYPNPASDYLIIDNGNHALMAGYSIQIKNNTGQQVFQSAINQAQFTVDLSSWTGDGLYFVHILDPQGATVTIRKIILQ